MAWFETLARWLGLTMTDAVVTAASAAVVALLVLVAWLMGFRQAARVDQHALQRLAAAEGAQLEAALIDPKGKAALARLAGGRLLIARAMADDIGARVAPAGAASVRLKRNTVRVAFGDLGYPPLSLKLKESPPDWLQALARE